MDHRLVSRLIGFMDMVLAMVGIAAALVVCALMLGGGTEMLVSATKTVDKTSGLAKSEKSDISNEAFTAILSGTIILVCFIGTLQMYGSWKLIKATEKNVYPSVGLRFCRAWRNITIFFVIMQVLDTVLVASGIKTMAQISPNIVLIIFHVPALFCVNNYMNLLEKLRVTFPTTTTLVKNADGVSVAVQPR